MCVSFIGIDSLPRLRLSATSLLYLARSKVAGVLLQMGSSSRKLRTIDSRLLPWDRSCRRGLPLPRLLILSLYLSPFLSLCLSLLNCFATGLM